MLATDFAAVLRLTLAGTAIGHIPSLVATEAVEAGALVPVMPIGRAAAERSGP